MMFSRFICRTSERLATLYKHISCQIPLLRRYEVESERNSRQFPDCPQNEESVVSSAVPASWPNASVLAWLDHVQRRIGASVVRITLLGNMG
jgi:hypothetical protein